MAYIGKITAGGSTYHVGSTLYGTCDTAGATAAKVAVVDGFDTLEAGVTVHIKFTNSNTAGSATLAIKPSSSGTATTAKSIYKYGTTVPGTTAATSWEPGAVVSLTYDGTAWIMNDYVQVPTMASQINALADTTLYASSNEVGGPARSAIELTTNAGQGGGNGQNNTPDIPIYFDDGRPQNCKIHIWTGSIAGNSSQDIYCSYGFVCVGRYYGGDRLWAGFVDQWGDGVMPIKATNTTSHCAVTVKTKGYIINISNKSANYMSYLVIGCGLPES